MEIRGSLNQLNEIVRATARQAVWQSIALVISLCMTIAGRLAYQTRVLDNRFEQIEERWGESEKKFAARSELSEKNLNTHTEQSEKNMTVRFEDPKQEVRAQRK